MALAQAGSPMLTHTHASDVRFARRLAKEVDTYTGGDAIASAALIRIVSNRPALRQGLVGLLAQEHTPADAASATHFYSHLFENAAVGGNVTGLAAALAHFRNNPAQTLRQHLMTGAVNPAEEPPDVRAAAPGGPSAPAAKRSRTGRLSSSFASPTSGFLERAMCATGPTLAAAAARGFTIAHNSFDCTAVHTRKLVSRIPQSAREAVFETWISPEVAVYSPCADDVSRERLGPNNYLFHETLIQKVTNVEAYNIFRDRYPEYADLICQRSFDLLKPFFVKHKVLREVH